jgi:hypothetical protein
MSSYKLYVNDRSYNSWEVFDTVNFNKINLEFNPIECKLFSNDVFSIDKNNNAKLLHSTIRSGPPMPGVLVLYGNKTYGRQHNKKASKLLYKCIPDDMRLPSFLVPYEIKNMGFSKVLKNLYVTFTFDEWNDKHHKEDV